MFAKITNTLLAAVIVTGATVAVAAAQTGSVQAPSLAEKIWMDRASGPADGN